MAEEELVCVGVYPTEIPAHIARTRLEASGIQCQISADNCVGWHPELSLTQGIRLVVRASDAEEAAQILEEGKPDSGDKSHTDE